MPPFIEEELKPTVEDNLFLLKRPVKILLFTKTKECPTCEDQKQLLQERISLNNKVTLEIYDIEKIQT